MVNALSAFGSIPSFSVTCFATACLHVLLVGVDLLAVIQVDMTADLLRDVIDRLCVERGNVRRQEVSRWLALHARAAASRPAANIRSNHPIEHLARGAVGEFPVLFRGGVVIAMARLGLGGPRSGLLGGRVAHPVPFT